MRTRRELSQQLEKVPRTGAMKRSIDACTWVYRAACALVLFVSACSVEGCKRLPGSSTISVVPQSVIQEGFLNERAGIDQTVARFGINAQWNRPSDTDPQRQIDLIAAAIKAHSYGIVVNPAYEAATNTVVQDALAQGIPVVVARDSIPLAPQAHLSFVLSDEQAGAELAAHRLCSDTKLHGYVAIVGLDNYAADSLRRLDATENALRRICPSLQIGHSVASPYSSSFAQIAVQRLLDQHPDMVALVALNPVAGIGAANVMEELYASAHHSHRTVRIIVFDQSIPLMLRLRRGVVDAIVGQNMRGIGVRAVENILHDRRGEPYSHSVTFAPMLITRDNVDESTTQEWLLFGWEQP